ncbi:alpha/beta hydrolase [Nitratireductor kimnyeongensis]|uniref:Alpha/beta hydrolase n=1 Tax=Nitratireductor kimnyeongensis TaxID=430679 RepID=A0ABW0T9R5_9HYPH|nr:alpha/beta fold hydrolase [Nitratireductor kimnyeongensis]QZZ35702.1 lysophospholipase [Nitratireductor kimnyeongensis]
MTRFSVRFLKILFGTFEYVAPSLGGRLAFWWFCRTPDPMQLSEKERHRLARSKNFMQQARRHHLTTTHGEIVAHEFVNWGARRDGPAVLVLHGWRSRAEHMQAVVEALLRRGFRVVSLDLPGHGASGGRSLNIVNAVAAVSSANEWLGPFDAMVGHSFGGAVALNAIAGSVAGIAPVRVRRLVMVASPNALPELFLQFGAFLGLGVRTQNEFEGCVEDIAGLPLREFVAVDQLRQVQIPTLIVHAPEDKEVPAPDAIAMGGVGEHVSVVWAPGLGHRRIIADTGIAAQAAAFVATHRDRWLKSTVGAPLEDRLPVPD